MESANYIDLHVHSNKSDGMDSVAKIIDMALKNNVSVLALAEHYNFTSFELAKKIARNSIEIVPALELGTDMTKLGYTRRSRCHILVYYPKTEQMYQILNEYEATRDEYVKKVVKELNLLGIEISIDEIKANARDAKSIGRYDVASLLIKFKIVDSIEEAYNKYLGYNKENSIERRKPTPIDLISKISTSGVPILAHPNSLGIIHSHGIITEEQDCKFRKLVESLMNAGLKGIEVQTSFTTPDKVEYYTKVAEDFNILTTVGSDYHGRKNDSIQIGRGINNNICIENYAIIQKLKKIAKV